MATLFSKGRIGSLELPNRLVRAASHEGLADERGAPTERQTDFYRRFVEGGIGLVITGYAGVQPNGKSALYRMTMIDSDDLVPAHRAMVDGVHAAGGRIVLQIAHCGRQTSAKEIGTPDIVAPSALRYTVYGETPRALAEHEIGEVVESFAAAARRAREAGYDGVEVHAAHGYLLASFLSRASNRRTDAWGGTPAKRFRIVERTLRAVRAAVGEDFPILLKLNAYESGWEGIRPYECVDYAQMVEATGCCDAIEVSAGTNANVLDMARGALPPDAVLHYYRPFSELHPLVKAIAKPVLARVGRWIARPFVQGYNLATAAMVKAAVRLPVITVGGMRERAFMEAAIRDGKTDFVSLARPLLLEPDLARKFERNESEAARCDNCNICVIASDTVPIRCHRGELPVC